MSTVELVADMRELTGKKVKALRRSGFIPAHIVVKGKESRNIQIAHLPLVKTLDIVGFTQPIELVLGKDKVIVLVTNVTFTPAKNTIEHVTFQEVKKGELVTADVPLQLVGEAPGVQLGLILLQVEDSVQVETGALSIPEYLDVDVSGFKEEGDNVRAGELVLPDGAKLITDPDATVARLEAPRAAEPEPEEVSAEDGEEASEGEEEDGSEQTES